MKETTFLASLDNKQWLNRIVQRGKVKILHHSYHLSILFGMKEFHFLTYWFLTPPHKSDCRFIDYENIFNVRGWTRLKIATINYADAHGLEVIFSNEHQCESLLIHPFL